MAPLLAKRLAALCVLVSALTGCGSLSETIRYRLTINVEVDGKLVSGSGVVQVKQSDTRGLFGSMGGFGNEVSGEAVVVDLGLHGTLFALLHGPKAGYGDLGGPAWMLFHAFADLIKSETDPLPQVRLLREQHAHRVLKVDEVPMLVRFRDLDDPKSVEQIDPRNLAATFGSGVSLRDVAIEVTQDPLTAGIQAKLPWLKAMKTHLDGDQYHSRNTLANELTARDFYRRDE
ncbi:hypothetical protein [Bradyrhizobium betae]|uniref:Lipoprotein n=1 Tax=Bradyrhizobium betae TaxID=244734 RepID=A0A5P6PI05_9BRAD|nr:hypothetical protein [Bradyrhizobium betae]MCS3725869.1 hypothetical protein [Bradyrhizobium betae]QFI77003.1 hypothetical protein F8237_34210 [Bradyrhizobium betae]